MVCVLKAFDAETYDYIGTFLSNAGFDNLRFVYFVGNKLFVVDGDSNQYVHIYYKLDADPETGEKDITDEVAGTYTAAGIAVNGVRVGESGNLTIALNGSNDAWISGDVRWIPLAAGDVPFTEDSGGYSVSLTFNTAGEQDVVIRWQKQIYINSFSGWQTTDSFGFAAIPVTVAEGTNALAALIEEAEQTESNALYGDRNGYYPPEQEAILTNAIAEAQSVADKIFVVSAEYNDAINALQAALDAFNQSEITVDYQPFNDLIDSATNIKQQASVGNGNGQHPADAITALQNAIDAAAAIAENPHLSQQEVEEAIDELQAAINTFNASIISMDTGALADAISQAEKIQKGNYSVEAWNALQKAISDAKALLSKQHVTQSEIDVAIKAINDAIKAIEEKPTPNIPDTGDDIGFSIIILIAALSFLIMFASLAKRNKKADF